MNGWLSNVARGMFLPFPDSAASLPTLVPGLHTSIQRDQPDVFGGLHATEAIAPDSFAGPHITLSADSDTIGGPHTSVQRP